MMEILLSLLLLFIFVTLIGHGSWVVIAAVVQAIRGDRADSSSRSFSSAGAASQRVGNTGGRNEEPVERHSPVKDLGAFERMVDALSSTEQITAKSANQLKAQARQFAGVPLQPDQVPPADRVLPPPAENIWATPVGETTSRQADFSPVETRPSVEQPSAMPPAIVPAIDAPEVLQLHERDLITSSVPMASSVTHAPPTVKRAFSEIVTSFLADHNIRWGELVAGLMIVVCSIGLVVSLWSTITATHRVVPSLIFMSADAAIFAAGLYTMRRWKLRHTSRAVLIIATLLVPLCVLAGLAAAGANIQSVSLLSPITLGAIAVGTIGCGWLLWQASLALVGRGGAAALTASVVAPTLCLPLLPTVARTLAEGAGSFLFVPAIATALTILWPARRHCQIHADGDTRAMKVGRRFWKNHWLRLGIALASFAAVLVYAAYLFQTDGRVAWIQIAIASVPVWIALAAVHGCFIKQISVQTKWAMPRYLSSVMVLVSIGCVVAILPASIERVAWLWSHGIAVAVAGAGAGWLLRKRLPYLEATVPLGIAAMLSSPAWLAGLEWNEVSVWRTILGGEPLLIALAMAVFSSVAWVIAAKVNTRQTLPLVPAFWGVMAGGQAIVLSVAPPSWLGMLPVTGLACVLLAAMIGAAIAATRRTPLVYVSLLAAVCFWITCIGLVQWGEQAVAIVYQSIPIALLGLAGSMLLLAIGLTAFFRSTANAAVASLMEMSAAASCGLVGSLAMLAVFAGHHENIIAPSWLTTTWMTAAASTLLIAATILVSKRLYLQLAMLISAIAMFAGMTHVGGVELWQTPAWKNADAVWSLASVLLVTAAFWLLLRELTQVMVVKFRATPGKLALVQNQLSSLGLISQNPSWSRRQMPDGGMLVATVGLLIAGIGWQYLAVLFGPLGAPLNQWFQFDMGSHWDTVLRFGVLAGAAGSVWLFQHREPNAVLQRILGVVGALSGLLLAMVVSARLTEVSTLRLIGTTTLACGGVLAAWTVSRWLARRRAHSSEISEILVIDRAVGAFTIAVLIAMSSIVLLWANWWIPVSANITPDRWSTLAVSLWWIAASIGLRFATKPTSMPIVGVSFDFQSVLSAMLLPAAVGISVPVIFFTPAVVWWQASVLGSIAWLAISWGWSNRFSNVDTDQSDDQGNGFSRVWIGSVGLVTAAMVLWGLLIRADWTAAWSLPIGVVVSLLGWLVCCREGALTSTSLSLSGALCLRNLPFLPIVISGHAAVAAIVMGWIGIADAILVVMGSGLLACLGSTIVVWITSRSIHAWHVSGQAVVLTGFAFWDWQTPLGLTMSLTAWPYWMALVGLAIAGVALMRFASDNTSNRDSAYLKSVIDGPIAGLSRALGWFVVLAGGCVFMIHPQMPAHELILTTCLMAWIGVWVAIWRSDRLSLIGNRQVPRADIGVSWLLLPLLMISLLISLNGMRIFSLGNASVPMTTGLFQCLIAFIVAATAFLRPTDLPNRLMSKWTVSLWLIVGGVAMGANSVAMLWTTENVPRAVVSILAATFSTSVIVWSLPAMEKLRVRLSHRVTAMADLTSPPQQGDPDRLGIALERVIMALVVIGTLLAGVLSWSDAETSWIRLSVLAIGILAWSLFQLSEQTTEVLATLAQRRRYRCVYVGLWTLALIAVIGEPRASEWLLTATMRLLIASVLAIGVLVLTVPRLLSGPFLQRWQGALRRGGWIAACATAGSVLAMLVIEVLVREGSEGIPGIGRPMVIVVAMIMGGLSLMTAAIAILSGPGFENTFTRQGERANWLQLDDSRRRWLLYAAQSTAGLTWLHVFLCRTGLAFLGLRHVWPYVVMLLAFASVGLTQWAIRRGDQVLSEAMRKNAMFLPLIPVVGFWLSGAYATMVESQMWSWTFYRGTASYQGLLIIGAIYYGVLSVMWKRGLPRIATVVLANGALWVMLTQMPGWDFLTHPQAWLIPPAVCVLAVAYWQRDRLDSATGSAIRYAATLVIYISSTADMLMSEIGSSLWGPVILIALSLAGMLIGVALRIKPFLYLGTIFVFLGVTSMVWHAGQAIDAVWPWWVFGITTGLILLSLLAGIEKHRDKLQRWSSELAQWEN